RQGQLDPARRGDPAMAGTESGEHRRRGELLGEDDGPRLADLPFEMGVAVADRRQPAAPVDAGCQGPAPLRERTLVVRVPRSLGGPRPVPDFDGVEEVDPIHERAARVGRLWVRGRAQATGLAYVIEM